MKLELKHILPYIPYGVRYTGLRKGWAFPDVEFILCLVDLTDNNKYEYIKPHLRPLSDLTKEIEHNGEMIVPVDCLENANFNIDEEWVIESTDSLPYFAIEMLLEWHFDIFGLIEKGLAIDKNTFNS